MIDSGYLSQIAGTFGFSLTGGELAKLDTYAAVLTEWNQKINLTAIVEPDEICVKHFLDSLLLLDALDVPAGAAIIDVGAGAGFPSVPCRIIREDIKLTLLDSLNKRISFLSALSRQLGQDNHMLHSRAEEAGRQKAYRERYDIATARAVAHLRELSEYCLPFVKPGGYFAALKGYEVEDELSEAQKAVDVLGGAVCDVKKYELPDGSRRAIVIIKKVGQTPAKYPRLPAKIKKSPII